MHDDIRVVPPVAKPEPPKPTEEEKSAFHTPEEIAAHDTEPTEVIDLSNDDIPSAPTEPTSQKKQRKFWPPSKKQWMIIGGVFGALVIVGGFGFYLASKHQPTVANISRPKTPKVVPAAPKPTTVASTLSGLPVAPAVNQRPITAVMIENTPMARPQSGLSGAGVVFEALTEGGISRFMALFQDQTPTNVGPVRSVRPYYIDWALGFNAAIAHMGGSPQALTYINTSGARNLDGMSNPGVYRRSASRPAPHNLYTSIPSLISLEQSKGWNASNFSGWPRKTDSPMKTPNAATINFDLSYSTYNVQYNYDASTNSYNRSEGGAPHIDANTNTQLSPKVVIGMIVPWSEGSLDTSNAYYSVYQTVGSGQAYVFQDGTLTIGDWSKASPNAPIAFTTASGQPLKLNAGQTWITALASTREITYN